MSIRETTMENTFENQYKSSSICHNLPASLPIYIKLANVQLLVFLFLVSSQFYLTKIKNLAMFYIKVNMTMRKPQHESESSWILLNIKKL